MTARPISIMLAELEARRDIAPTVVEAAHRLHDQGWTYNEIGSLLYGHTRRSRTTQTGNLLARHPERHPNLTIADPVNALTVYRLLTARVHDNITGLREQGVAVKDAAAAAGFSANAIWCRVSGRSSPETVRFPNLPR